MPTGDVELVILDGGGSIVVPQNTVMAVIGCSSAGTVAQVVASRNINSLIATFGYGPLVSACALIIAAGGTVLAVKATSQTAGVASAVTSTAVGGTSAVTVSGAANDTWYVKVLVTSGGTIATAPGARIQVSLDAGRTYGPVISLGAANTYVIQNTGLTLNFGAGTLVATATYTFGATEPKWNTAGVLACMNALQASPYALVGWGSTLVAGDLSASNAATLQTYANTWATGKLYSRLLGNARDAAPAAAWGGTPETEAAWTTAVTVTDTFSANDTKRVCVTAGHYNIASPIPNPSAGAPRERRPLSWVLAARQIRIPTQRHAGRVRDGSLQEIIVDAGDASDGFVYHDERLNPGFDAARFTAARTRIKKQGWYIANPNLMSATGSVFSLLPLGLVMDVACTIVTDVGQNDINEDIRLNDNGTIFENEALTIEGNFRRALDAAMSTMISGRTVAVDRDLNVRLLSKVKVTVTLYSRGYVLQEDIEIGFGTTETVAA